MISVKGKRRKKEWVPTGCVDSKRSVEKWWRSATIFSKCVLKRLKEGSLLKIKGKNSKVVLTISTFGYCQLDSTRPEYGPNVVSNLVPFTSSSTS